MQLPPVGQLQYLVALREELHFGKAARSLNVTQSTLSSGIRELEISLGITLVERTNRSLSLTLLSEKAIHASPFLKKSCPGWHHQSHNDRRESSRTRILDRFV